MYSCWNVDHSMRPTAPEIVDYLAMNPRIVSPCLDVPLSSVQLEHTGQFNIQLSKNNRKFSISWPSQRPSQNGSKSLNSPTPLLLDLNSQDDNQNESHNLESFLMGQSSEQDSSSPLLDSKRTSILKKTWLEENYNDNDNQIHRYVNLQPGMLKLACEHRNGNAGNIQMEERTSMLPEEKSTDNVSVLWWKQTISWRNRKLVRCASRYVVLKEKWLPKVNARI